MRTLATFLFFCMVVFCSAQNTKTFYVKKQSLDKKDESQKLFNFNLFPRIDTLPLNMVNIIGDITPIKGLYDSIATFNLKLKLYGTKAMVATPKYNCVASLKFFKKDDKGVCRLIYIRYFTVAGKNHGYMRYVNLPGQ